MKHLLLFLFLFFCFHTQAQVETQPKPPQKTTTTKSSSSVKAPVKKQKPQAFYLEMNLAMGVPLREFAATTDALPFGGNFAFFYQPSREIPLMIGADLGFMNMGYVSQDKVLSADISVGDVVIDQLIIPLRVQTSNNIFSGHVILRSVAPTKYFKPYVEGLFGFNNFWTSTEIIDDSPEHYVSSDDNDVISHSNQVSDAALSYGAGGGLLVQLGKTGFLNLRADYLFGGNMRYYDKSQTQYWEVEISDSFEQSTSNNYEKYNDAIEVNAVPKESKTNMLVAQLGFTFMF